MPLPTWEIRVGDALEVLRGMESASVQTCVTSPPYWGLRDYDVDGQLGLEETPEEYVENMVAVFREVRRVLRDDGTLWLNLGDSYAANRSYQVTDQKWRDVGNEKASTAPNGLKPKDLVGIPWRVSFALQSDGWWLRSDIIWHKESCMPESVTDRPTSAHEHVFLLAKSESYYYDHVAVAEPSKTAGRVVSYDGTQKNTDHENRTYPGQGGKRDIEVGRTRNRRNVWTINPKAFPLAHFAVYPPALIEPCIQAGTSEKGACAECGAPWERVVELGDVESTGGSEDSARNGVTDFGGSQMNCGTFTKRRHQTTGWQPTCDCDTDDVVPCTVLDPFAGAGTTGVVALREGQSFIGIELNPEYAEMSRERIREDGREGNRVDERSKLARILAGEET